MVRKDWLYHTYPLVKLKINDIIGKKIGIATYLSGSIGKTLIGREIIKWNIGGVNDNQFTQKYAKFLFSEDYQFGF